MSENLHFILVHGAWHGGWCREKVAPLLREAGCAATVPVLSGPAHLAASRRRRSAGGDCREIDVSHDMMITHPRKLSKLLIDCTARPRGLVPRLL